VVCNTIKGLLAHGHEVSLFSLNPQKSKLKLHEPDELISRINYRTHQIDISISVKDAVLNLFNRNSYYIDRFDNPDFEKLLIQELKKTAYDVVQFEGLYVSPYIPVVRKHSRAKLIYRPHNIEHQVWQRLAAQKHDPIKKAYLQLIAKRVKKYELLQLNKFDAIAAFTEQDKNTMQKCGATVPVAILPLGLDMNRYQPDPTKTEFPSLFFLGSLGWLPNREGIEWFLQTFYNDLASGDLRVKLYVAGNDIPESFDDYEALGKIFIQGEVDDAYEFLNSKSIMIVPLLSGGGMRVKIVEGMAMEKCIISTSIGAEGIKYTHGVNILIADNRDEFYEAIKRCIADEEYCRNIGRNARKLVEEQHDLTQVGNNLVGFYQQVCDA
jgi:glycosyltransferase involved in cell wall biosynthesis